MAVMKSIFGFAMQVMQLQINILGYRVTLFGAFLYSLVGFLLLYAFYRLMR